MNKTTSHSHNKFNPIFVGLLTAVMTAVFGFGLWPLGTTLYWLALTVWSLALVYLVFFGVMPMMDRRMRSFASRIGTMLNARPLSPVTVPAVKTAPAARALPGSSREYSSYEGFKSYAQGGALSIDDIVKGLSRHPHAAAGHAAPTNAKTEPIYEKVEPVFERVEPIYENVEMVATVAVESEAGQPHIRGFAAALVGGDRVAVFAGLRQHIRGGGVPEHLLSKTVCLIDDAYRSRIDGTVCDPDIARLTARLDTPTLERLVTSLTIAIDSSYSTGVTGAKLALTRALSVLGA